MASSKNAIRGSEAFILSSGNIEFRHRNWGTHIFNQQILSPPNWQPEVSLFPKHSLKTRYKRKSSWDAGVGLGLPGTKHKPHLSTSVIPPTFKLYWKNSRQNAERFKNTLTLQQKCFTYMTILSSCVYWKSSV